MKPLKVNTASRATLEPIGIDPLELNIDDQNFVHNFIVCTKLNHIQFRVFISLRDTGEEKTGTCMENCFLRCEGMKMAKSMKTNDL